VVMDRCVKIEHCRFFWQKGLRAGCCWTTDGGADLRPL
jgi:hypothetical protein